jgi:hypothetical protein
MLLVTNIAETGTAIRQIPVGFCFGPGLAAPECASEPADEAEKTQFPSVARFWGVVTIVGSALSRLPPRFSLDPSFHLFPSSYPTCYFLLLTSRGVELKHDKNRTISPKKIVPSFGVCPWVLFGCRICSMERASVGVTADEIWM